METTIQLWDFQDLVRKIADAHRDHKTYFTGDTARTIQLYAMAREDRKTKRVSIAASNGRAANRK